MSALVDRNAGSPATWLRHYRRDIKEGHIHVPCNGCTACCRAGMAPEVLPRERDALRDVTAPDGTHIPLAADGRTCSQLVDGRCAIYARRPRVCRQYDCRLLLFTGIKTTDQPEVNEALGRWCSELKTPEDRKLAAAILAARRQYLASPNFKASCHVWERAGEILLQAMRLLNKEKA